MSKSRKIDFFEILKREYMSFLSKKERLFAVFNQNFDLLVRQINKQEYVSEVENFIQELQKVCKNSTIFIQSDIRKFISAFVIVNHKDVVLDVNDTKSLFLYNKGIELLDSFENIFKNNLNPSYINRFFDNFNQYLNIFQQWRMGDKVKILDKYARSYHQLQDTLTFIEDKDKEENKEAEENPAHTQWKNSLSNLKSKLETQIINIDGQKGLNYVKNLKTPEITPMIRLYEEIEVNMKQAFWDDFEEKVNEGKYEVITPMLKDYRTFLFKLIPNRPDIQKQFDSELDLELLDQMIKNNSVSTEDIYKIIQTLTNYIKMLQAPSDDKDTEEFISNLEKGGDKMGTYLRYFFQNVFQKFEKIVKQINDFVNDFKL